MRIKNQRSHGGPALCAWQGRLHVVHQGDSSNQLWHSIYDGTWRPNVQIENQSSAAGVGLSASGSGVVTVHVGASSAALWDSVYSR